MKTKGKKLLAIVLTISLCMGNMVVVNADKETEHTDSTDSMDSSDLMDIDSIARINGLDWDTATEEDCDMKIRHQITSHWDNHYNVDVTLENMTDERIDNWEICIPANYEIENIWNAKVTDHTDGEYTIHNAEWNQDIAVGGSVSFGMTVSCSGEMEFPEYVYTLALSELLDEKEYKIEFKKHSQWDGKFNGQIIITNLGEKPIEDWNMSFVCNFEIEQIWNAAVEDSFWTEGLNYCDVENPGYNQNIAPNQSVEFGFIAAVDGKPKLSRMELYKITSDSDLSDEDEENESEDEYDEDWFLKDSDCFDTREEYEQYLKERGYTDDALMDLDELAASSRSKKRAKKAKRVVLCASEDLNVKQWVLPTQHYMPLANGASYLMKSKDDNNAYVIKRTVGPDEKVSYSKQTMFKGFAHGQTFEQFTNSSHEEYYLLGGGGDGMFAHNLAIMPRGIFENQVSSGKKIRFTNWRKGLFRIMTGLECANKEQSGEGKGNLYRVDAALTADGSTIVIWKEFQKGEDPNKELYHEISLYNMKKIMKIYKQQWKSAKKNKKKSLELSFKKNKGKLKKALIGSFWEKFPGGRKSVLKPNASFQSIDIENYVENDEQKWRIVITSGNEIKRTQDATITRLEVKRTKKKGKRGITYEAFRDDISFEGEPDAKLELEGGHIMNGKTYDFLAVKKVTTTRKDGTEGHPRHLFLATVNLLDIKTKIR